MSSMSVRRRRKLKRINAASADGIGFEHFAEAAECAQSLDHFFERLAPRKRSGVDVAQDRLHHLRDVRWLDLLVINLWRCAQREILHQQEVDFVAVDVAFRLFAKMALNQPAQACFAGVQRRHL